MGNQKYDAADEDNADRGTIPMGQTCFPGTTIKHVTQVQTILPPHPFLNKLGRGLHGDAACKIGRLFA